jgi:hypothetical protein
MNSNKILALAIVGSLAIGAAAGFFIGEVTDNENEGDDDLGVLYSPVIKPADFVSGINNEYFPLTPGTTLIYEAASGDVTERIEINITHETKQILGVTCIVVRDTVSVDGEVKEDTYDWYAQDIYGNVWYFGEDTKEYENGEVVSTSGSWEAGVDGAKPGIIMLANPIAGMSYRQEYYEGEAEDKAEIISLNESATVSYGTYNNLVMTREWTPLDTSLTENKYYAPGIGVVLEVTVKGGTERVELTDIIHN